MTSLQNHEEKAKKICRNLYKCRRKESKRSCFVAHKDFTKSNENEGQPAKIEEVIMSRHI